MGAQARIFRRQWGASSVIVEQVNGQYVQSEPVRTGCVPP